MVHFQIKGRLLAEWTGGFWVGEYPLSIMGLSFDSRKLTPGSVFIALSYGSQDGHDFVHDAYNNGANAFIVERECNLPIPQLIVSDTMQALVQISIKVRQEFKGKMIGVTGSCGKTSTKDIFKLVLGESCHATPGNWNNSLGVPLSILGLYNNNFQFSVIEAGINKIGEMGQLSNLIKPNIVVITHLGAAHLEGLGSLDSIADEKSKLLKFAKHDAILIAPKSVLNYSSFDSYRSKSIAIVHGERDSSKGYAKQYIYNWKKLNDLTAEVTLETQTQKVVYSFSSLSKGMIQNSVLVIVSAIELGLDAKYITSRLESWSPVEGRGAIRKIGNSIIYQDFYNANPSSMIDGIKAFVSCSNDSQKRLYVIGTMDELGVDFEHYHESVAKSIPYRKGDIIKFIGNEEAVQAYISGAKSSGWDDSELEYFATIQLFKYKKSHNPESIFLKGSRSCKLEDLIPVITSVN